MVTAVGTVIGSSTVSGGGGDYVPFPSGQSVDESVNTASAMSSALRLGIDTLSANQTITFVRYVKVILPFDGYIFWVKASLLSKSALINNFALNTVGFNQPRRDLEAPETFTAKGSFHFATVTKQDSDENISINRVTFTSESPINHFNEIFPQDIYIASFQVPGKSTYFRFAFSERQNYYRQADLYHYRGDAVYPVMDTQIIDDIAQFDSRNIVVSNSMPIWLSLNKFMPMYPAYLVAENIRPPYCAVDIPPNSTRAFEQMAPRIDSQNNHWQLVTENVKLTLYGLRNFNSLDFLDYVFSQSLSSNTFGIMNTPVVRDERKVQSELNIIAMKKSIELEINYYQVTVRNLARQLILDAIPSLYVGGGVSAVELS